MATSEECAKVLTHIETHGVQEASGGYRLPRDAHLLRILGQLAPRCREPSQVDDGSSVWAPYEPTKGTVEYHAAMCWRLSRPAEDGQYYSFPAEAMRQLRMAAGVPPDPDDA